jgi:hypothetical protein
MQDESAPAINEAYRVFSRYRIGTDIDFAARVEVSDEEHRRIKEALTHSSLRTLSLEDTVAYFDYIDAAYYDGAFRTNEFRYFLPRALELIAREPAESDGWLRQCLQRCLARSSAISHWPQVELSVMNRFGLG